MTTLSSFFYETDDFLAPAHVRIWLGVTKQS
jgi:hypothetical protein